MKKELKEKINKLPQNPGVYLFQDKKGEIIYIGKSANLKKRVLSHFRQSNFQKSNLLQGTLINYKKIANLEFIETNSEAEALILERKLVKKYQPKYNIELKDDKDFLYVAFSQEELPRLSLIHQTKKVMADLEGPFPQVKAIKQFLKLLRKIFPYRTCKNKPSTPCLEYHLGFCNAHLKKTKTYPQVIKGIKVFLRLYNEPISPSPHLECFDVSHTQGKLTVGSMVTFIGKKPFKKYYRRFQIKRVKGINDPASLKEIIERRLKHKEWPYPDLIIIDGGKSQLALLKNLEIPVIALAKLNLSKKEGSFQRIKSEGFLYSPYSRNRLDLKEIPFNIKSVLLQIRDEAHRFAISYHRLKRKKEILEE